MLTGVLVTEVLGVKSNGEKQFVVVDAAMTEVIRPALYGAHHELTPLSTQVSSSTSPTHCTTLAKGSFLYTIRGPSLSSSLHSMVQVAKTPFLYTLTFLSSRCPLLSHCLWAYSNIIPFFFPVLSLLPLLCGCQA